MVVFVDVVILHLSSSSSSSSQSTLHGKETVLFCSVSLDLRLILCLLETHTHSIFQLFSKHLSITVTYNYAKPQSKWSQLQPLFKLDTNPSLSIYLHLSNTDKSANFAILIIYLPIPTSICLSVQTCLLSSLALTNMSLKICWFKNASH